MSVIIIISVILFSILYKILNTEIIKNIRNKDIRDLFKNLAKRESEKSSLRKKENLSQKPRLKLKSFL